MVSRNNTKLLDRQLLIKQAQRFGLRKTTVGLASVLLGTTFFMGGQSVAHADAESVSVSGSNSVPTETTNQAVGFQSEASVQNNGQRGVQVQNTQTVSQQVPVAQQVTVTQTQTQSNASVNTQTNVQADVRAGTQNVNTQVGAPENVRERTQVSDQNQSTQTSQTATQPLNVNQFKGNFDVLDAINNNHRVYTKAALNRQVLAAISNESWKDLPNAAGDYTADKDVTLKELGSGQSNLHYQNGQSGDTDYMGHDTAYFKNYKVITNSLPVNVFADAGSSTDGTSDGLKWSIDTPNADSQTKVVSDWLDKVNQDPNYLVGFLDVSGQRHYIDPSSLAIGKTGYGLPMSVTTDAVGMDDYGHLIRLGSWVITPDADNHQLNVTLRTNEEGKSNGVISPLPLFISSLNSQNEENGIICSPRVGSSSNRRFEVGNVSANGSVYYMPFGSSSAPVKLDTIGANSEAYYSVDPNSLRLSIQRKEDTNSGITWISSEPPKFVSGSDVVGDINNDPTKKATLKAYDQNDNVVGSYVVDFASKTPSITFLPNSGLSSSTKIKPLLVENRYNDGATLYTKPFTYFKVQPLYYASVPNEMGMKKVIIHYIDLKTGQQTLPDSTYEFVATRDTNNLNKDYSWQNGQPRFEHLSGPDIWNNSDLLLKYDRSISGDDNLSYQGGLKLTSKGYYDQSGSAVNEGQSFNINFNVPDANANLDVLYPTNNVSDWNPYVLTVATDKVNFSYLKNYRDAATGETIKQVLAQNQANVDLSDIPAGYQVVPNDDVPTKVIPTFIGSSDESGTLKFYDKNGKDITNEVDHIDTSKSPQGISVKVSTGVDDETLNLKPALTGVKNALWSKNVRGVVTWNSVITKDVSYDQFKDVTAGGVEAKEVTGLGKIADVTFTVPDNTLTALNTDGKTVAVHSVKYTYSNLLRDLDNNDGSAILAIMKSGFTIAADDPAHAESFPMGAQLAGSADNVNVKITLYDANGNEIKVPLDGDIIGIGNSSYETSVSYDDSTVGLMGARGENGSFVLPWNVTDGPLATANPSVSYSQNGWRVANSNTPGDDTEHGQLIAVGVINYGIRIGNHFHGGAMQGNVTGSDSVGETKNDGSHVTFTDPNVTGLLNYSNINVSTIKRTIHFVDSLTGEQLRPDEVQSIDFLKGDTDTKRDFAPFSVPQIDGYTTTVKSLPSDQVADLSTKQNYDDTIYYTPTAKYVVNIDVAKPDEAITITPQSSDKHGYKDSDFTRTITRTVNITSPTGTKSTLPVDSVTFTRNGHLNILTNKMTFDSWSENGSHTFADVMAKVPAVAGYTPNLDSNLNAVTVTPDSHDIVVNVTYSPIARSLTINYMNGATKVGAYVYNGHTGDQVNNVSSLVNSNLPKGYVIKQGLDFDSYTLTPADNQSFNVSVVPAITHLKPGDHGIGADQFIRTITRTITIDQSGGHASSQTQSVTFNRNIDWDEANNQAIYGTWSENGQHVFQSVDVPALTGYKPDRSVDAVTVTPDSQNSQVVVNYIPQPQSFKIIYVDSNNNNAQVESHRMAGLTGQLINLDIVAPTGYQLSPGQSIPKTVTLRGDTNSDITVYLTQKLDNIDPNNPATIPAGYTKADFTHTVTRDVTFVHPDATKSNQHQSFTFTRNGQYNEVTKKVIFGSWSNNGSFTFDPVTVVDIPGYKLDHVPGAVTVTPQSTNITDTVNYVAQPQSFKIIYVDTDNNNTQVKSDTVSGKTGQNVPVNIIAPTGYVLAGNQTFPHTWTFNGTSNPDITVKLSQKQDSVNPNDPSTIPSGYHESDFKRTITRTVTINDPHSGATVKAQTVTFTRGGKYNEITKQVAFDPWSENGSHVFPVVDIPVVVGYDPDHKIDALTVTPASKNSTETVNYLAQTKNFKINYVDADDGNKVVKSDTITGKTDQTVNTNIEVPDDYVLADGQSLPKTVTLKGDTNPDITVNLHEKVDSIDPNDPASWPDGLTEHDLKRDIMRIVEIIYPEGDHDLKRQEVKFSRDASYNRVTKKITFGSWSENGSHTFPALPVKDVPGYAPSSDVPALTVTPDSSTISEQVTYRALGQSIVVHFVGPDNKNVADQVLSGKTGERIQLVPATPQGWKIVPGQSIPGHVTFAGSDNPDITIHVVHDIVDVDPTDPSTIPDGYPLNDHDWKRVVTRVVNITDPKQSTTTRQQSTTFTRSVQFDRAINQYVFGAWSNGGKYVFNAVDLPSYAGYALNGSAPEETVTPDSKDETINVSYVANGQSTVYYFVDDDNQAAKVGADHAIAGKTNQDVDLNIVVPGGYDLAAGQDLPKTYHFKATDNSPLIIHLVHHQIDATNDPHADTTRTITRTIEITKPDGKVTTDSQSVKFTRSAKQDAITKAYLYGAWSNNGTQRFEAYIQPTLKGYDKTGSAPQVDVTPDTKDFVVKLGYTKQADRIIDPHDPSTWPSGLTRDDLIRDVIWTVTIHNPVGDPDVTTQKFEFTRGAKQDPVTDKITFDPWSDNGSHQFNDVNVKTFKGYTPSINNVDGIVVTPDSKPATATDVIYTKNANIPLDPTKMDKGQAYELGLLKDVSRQIEFDLPNAKPEIHTQTVTFSRMGYRDPVDDHITYGPWNNDGKAKFGSMDVLQVKGYQPSMDSVSASAVSVDDAPSLVVVTYSKLPDKLVDPGDPLSWIDGIKASDLKRTITRQINFDLPGGQPKTINQTVTFTRGGHIDQVTDQITWDSWSENGQHTFDAVDSPQVKGYDPSQAQVSALTVDPDSKSSVVNVAYNKQKDRIIDPNDPSTWPKGLNPDDLKRTITRTITMTIPGKGVQTTTQTVTFTRGGKQDPVTNKITFDPWSENGKHHFDAVAVPKVKGYDPSLNEVPAIDVTPDTKIGQSNINVTYTKQKDHIIDPNDSSTWPKGMNPSDVKRTITRKITFELPNGSTQQVLQTVTFTRGGKQDPVTGHITWDPWSENGKHHFNSVPVISQPGYTPSITQIPALDVTPDTKLDDSGVIKVTYTKNRPTLIDPNDPDTWPNGLTTHDLKRTITRTVTFKLPNGNQKVVVQTVTFTRGGQVDPVTGKITFDPWSENGRHHFNDIDVPTVKGYDSSVKAIPGMDVTPDTVLDNGGEIDITYTKQANKLIDPNDPSTWPKGVTKDDMFRHIERTIIYQTPDGYWHRIRQQVNFTRGGEVDPVDGHIIWYPWSENGHHHFRPIQLPNIPGYVVNPSFIPGLDVTPDTKLDGADKMIKLTYVKKVVSYKTLSLNDPSSWPAGVTADDFQKTVTRTIKFDLPGGIQTKVQTVTLTRTGILNEDTGQIMWNPWSSSKFAAVDVPQVSGYTPSQTTISEMNVDGSTKDSVVKVTYQKNDDDQNDSIGNAHANGNISNRGFGSTSQAIKPQGLVMGMSSANGASDRTKVGNAGNAGANVVTVSIMSNAGNTGNGGGNSNKLPQTGNSTQQDREAAVIGAGLVLGMSSLAFGKRKKHD